MAIDAAGFIARFNPRMRPLLVLVVVVVEKLEQGWMLLDEVMALDLEMERIP